MEASVQRHIETEISPLTLVENAPTPALSPEAQDFISSQAGALLVEQAITEGLADIDELELLMNEFRLSKYEGS